MTRWMVNPGAIAAIGAVALGTLVACRHAEERAPETEVAVDVSPVIRATLHGYVDAYGSVEPERPGQGVSGGGARLAAPIAGIVLHVDVTEGQRVEAGAVVVELDDRVVRPQVEKAERAVEFATRQAERQRMLRPGDATSVRALQEAEQQLATARAELEAARGQLAQVHVATPVGGVVARVRVRPGDAVDGQTVLAEIVDPTRLIVTTQVPAVDAGVLAPGQATVVSETSEGSAGAPGEVTFVAPQVDTQTGTVLVRIAMSPGSTLRPGQFVRVRIVSEEHRDRLAVPVEAVIRDGEGRGVVFRVEDGRAQAVHVTTGLQDGALWEVEGEELAPGTAVVTRGAYGLPAGTKIVVSGR